ncbi:MBL fold metallo-hydrolase [Paenibacillus macquariensis]|uniref:Glyoxylase, beta-lactamase superfamily II n=1 Tax=Paenibacillus macquariensis TaxID=948756 RepID=A0ABY1KBG4_9BACL|nr:MBL fold metallo-hydrolase [Paenibacillus macquariensis]MEC0094259.1 MBL fold metallo-hydrolase [Paenibacillus macquariensis]OAB32152.1 hydrolase glyoxylase [Paenibacillus macquariensis subsp. macquariensis]SIR55268.1 Glyoxylase, beta-lactamase superfamily II [Paenibacillus macquariensis]
MKITQISEHIWSLKIWIVIPIHVCVVVEEDGVTLVDAGLPFMAKGILQFIENLQAGPLTRIVLTHGHGDHVGAIEKILEVTQVPIFAHRIEIPYIEGEMPYPRRKKAAISVAKQRTQPLPENEHGELQSMGGLTPYLTPGHSPGHVAYYHQQDQVLLVGDLFTAKKGKLRKPMAIFTGDMEEAIRSSAIVSQLKPLRLEVCHGTSVLQPANQLDTYLKS